MKSLKAKKTIALILAMVFCHLMFKTNGQSIPENGVSKKLAWFRKESVSNILYDLQFDIPIRKDSAIHGKETIFFTLKKNTAPLQIDFKGKIPQLKTVKVNKKEIPVQFQNEHLLIQAAYLKEGKNEVFVAFTSGDAYLNRKDSFLYTLLVPAQARTVFPCFDQPDLKAVFKLELRIPKPWKAISNGVAMDSTLVGAYKILKFSPSDTISTYLFAFAAGYFEQAHKNIGIHPADFLYRETSKSKIKNSLDTIFNIQANAIRFLENYTQIRYPFHKMGFAAIPSFQYNGMEHPGAIFFKSKALFLDSSATITQTNWRILLESHEVSHMWFGNLVTMVWFDDVWLKEVFANFMADKILQKIDNTQNFDLMFFTQHYPLAYDIDRTSGANPIRQNLDNLKDAGMVYGDIIYHKAPIMFRQLELLIGKDTLMFGLRQYLKKYAFGNCTWPDLIEILDQKSNHNLKSWSESWVNQPGRPVFDYNLRVKNNTIEGLTITQKDESGANKIWPQLFKISLLYKDHADDITVRMENGSIDIKEALGKEKPLSVLFNTTGAGYGVFPVDTMTMRSIGLIKNPVSRASFCQNLYENMFYKKHISPISLLRFYRDNMLNEPEELTLKLITKQLIYIYWRLISTEERNRIVPDLEEKLWDAMTHEQNLNKKKILFKTYEGIALTPAALEKLYAIWLKNNPPPDVKLNGDDYTELAMDLTVRDYKNQYILDQELLRLSGDDKSKFRFMLPAISSSVSRRDSFFAALWDKGNLRNEDWVLSAMQYLHHPLRTSTSINYLRQSLDSTERIQQNGDIFFVTRWLHASLDNYNSIEASHIVQDYLKANPSLSIHIRRKVLQSTDGLSKAKSIVYGD